LKQNISRYQLDCYYYSWNWNSGAISKLQLNNLAALKCNIAGVADITTKVTIS
jgi:hypothetical protein